MRREKLHDLNHPDFNGCRIQIRIEGGRKCRVLRNGEPVESENGTTFLEDCHGNTRMIAFTYETFSPLPIVHIDNDRFDLVPRLRWYEQLFVILPITLMGIGGAIGGGIAGIAIVLNVRVFQKNLTAPMKYALGLAVLVAAYGVWFIAALLVTLCMNLYRHS